MHICFLFYCGADFILMYDKITYRIIKNSGIEYSKNLFSGMRWFIITVPYDMFQSFKSIIARQKK